MPHFLTDASDNYVFETSDIKTKEFLSYRLQRPLLHSIITFSTSSQLMVEIHKGFQVSEHIKEHGFTIIIRKNF